MYAHLPLNFYPKCVHLDADAKSGYLSYYLVSK